MFNPFIYSPAINFLSYRNAGVEAVFYDLGQLTEADTQNLQQDTAKPSDYVLYVPGEPVRLLNGPIECALALNGQPFDVCLAGVGSSILGVAAMLKQVAKQNTRAGIGVISDFGLLNFQFDLGRYMWSTGGFGSSSKPDEGSMLPDEGSCQSLVDLLLCDDLDLREVVAHSRGAYLLRESLRLAGPKVLEKHSDLKIITLGGVVDFGEAADVTQYIGELDWMGRLYSDLGVKHEDVRYCGHHLNPSIPASMPLEFLSKKNPA